jgi:hypothetical protein
MDQSSLHRRDVPQDLAREVVLHVLKRLLLDFLGGRRRFAVGDEPPS